MSTISTVSRQWASRPADERFTNLLDLQAYKHKVRQESRAVVVSSRIITAQPADDDNTRGLQIVGPNGHAYAPTHHSFQQLATLAEAPAGYLRTLPSPVAADCINWGLHYKRGPEDVGVLLRRNGSNILTAATGPRYGRVWDADVVDALVARFGDGLTGQWRQPGEFGKAVEITKANCTLYASDRNMFVFLCDEQNRIEIPNRRDGHSGSAARGFYVWNSEVGDTTLGIATFMFDYACSNRTIWGASNFQQIKIRHTASAPDRFIEEVAPALISYSQSSSEGITSNIRKAQAARIGDTDKVSEFLAKRFGKRIGPQLQALHLQEEGRPIETLWDASVAVTASARAVVHQDARVELERQGGELIELAAR